jgi:glycosyltransferase involved in cell wall biosynthesis|tara:strand:+ start:1918 stop:3261 length:1344 start_codon:yes stop_codon:yes gene_type:complete
MKPLMLITAPVATRSGYGSHSRDLVRGLISMDKFDIHINSMPWGNCPMNALNDKNPNDKVILDRVIQQQNLQRQPEVHIQISVPNEFTPLAKYNIGITAGIETTAPKPEWIQGMNKMDLNIVPSKFTKEVFEKTTYEQMDEKTNQKIGEVKVLKPIEVLFEGIDTNIYKKTDKISEEFNKEMNKISEKFAFLYTGHWLQGGLGEDRKDTGMLVKTFLESFKNHKRPPALIMKTSGATFSIIDRNDILQKIEEIKKTVKGNLPKIYVLHGDLTDEEMNEMYNHPKVKAHVSFTHGEGFGRPLLEASVSEKPVIAPNWSGHIDFLNKQNAVLLPGSLTKVPAASLPKEMHVEQAQWFTINYQYASQMLKSIFKSKKNFTFKAKKLAMYNRVSFSLDNMNKKFETMLDNYLPKFQEQAQSVNLKLPKLKKVGDDKPAEPTKMKLPKLKRV